MNPEEARVSKGAVQRGEVYREGPNYFEAAANGGEKK
jgi:hypothetical protein